MDTPGKVLKNEREKLGKSLKEISVNLKLSTEYLTAIEDDDYSQIPAEVFTKAYLRLYADELGLNGDYILSLFNDYGKDDVIEEIVLPEKKSEHSIRKVMKSAFHAVSTAVIKIKSALTVDPASLKKLKPSININFDLLRRLKPSINIDFSYYYNRAVALMPSRKYLLIAVAVISVVLVAIMISDLDKSAPDRPIVADKQVVSEKPLLGNKEKLRPAEKMKVQSDKKKKRIEEKISGKLVLKIIAEELTWASVSIDGGKHKESLLRAGDAVTVWAEEGFDLKIGNAGGTKLNLNGKELGKLGPHGKVVNIKLP